MGEAGAGGGGPVFGPVEGTGEPVVGPGGTGGLVGEVVGPVGEVVGPVGGMGGSLIIIKLRATISGALTSIVVGRLFELSSFLA